MFKSYSLGCKNCAEGASCLAVREDQKCDGLKKKSAEVAKADGEDEDGEDTDIKDEGEQEETGAM